jgi:hypothetical protein
MGHNVWQSPTQDKRKNIPSDGSGNKIKKTTPFRSGSLTLSGISHKTLRRPVLGAERSFGHFVLRCGDVQQNEPTHHF